MANRCGKGAMLRLVARLSSRLLRRKTTMKSDAPVVVVLGATGAGKSKLALEIAASIDGEIVSADSMQVYKGLDIVTNKVTREELEVCPHHMIAIADPLDTSFTAAHFKNQVIPIIKDIHSRGKVPIIAGGTNYYVEGILWDQLLSVEFDSDDTFAKDCELDSSKTLHERLQKVDPKTASLLHPNDRRKIIHALHIYERTKTRMSDHHKKQQKVEGGSGYGGALRYPNTCMLWVQCDPQVLEKRVRRRVEKMIERGLVKELKDFHRDYNQQRLKDGEQADYEHGIFQSIGFKEFHQYLTAGKELNEKDRQVLFENSVEKMNINTWKYAKYQTKWMDKRLLRRSNALPIYPFDGSDPNKWDDLVRLPALKVLQRFFDDDYEVSERLSTENLENVDYVAPLEAKPLDKSETRRVFKICDVCNVSIQASSWHDHINSKKHRYHLKKLKHFGHTSEILKKRLKVLKDEENKAGIDKKENIE